MDLAKPEKTTMKINFLRKGNYLQLSHLQNTFSPQLWELNSQKIQLCPPWYNDSQPTDGKCTEINSITILIVIVTSLFTASMPHLPRHNLYSDPSLSSSLLKTSIPSVCEGSAKAFLFPRFVRTVCFYKNWIKKKYQTHQINNYLAIPVVDT